MNPSKQKGNAYERELVKEAQEEGLEAKRAWGSNGRSLGLEDEVDLVIEDKAIQAKRRKKLADFLQIPDCCDAVAFRQDRGDTLVLLKWETYLNHLKYAKIQAPTPDMGH